MNVKSTAEHTRLEHSPNVEDDWRVWGPYVSGRQWGTVREDYSADGDSWRFFPFNHAHTRAYRWGEDGIAGLCDRYGFLNVGVALWNGNDDRLKERLFGLTGHQGNHAEDVKEYWWHLDATPTHSYAEYLYRYPHAAFPYDILERCNADRGYHDDEFELSDTGVLEENRFFDVVTRHAKASPFDILIEFSATNHGPEPAELHLIPQLWFRNTWSWGDNPKKPSIAPVAAPSSWALELHHAWLGTYVCAVEGDAEVMFCDNETNVAATFGVDSPDGQPDHPKDAINNAVVHGDRSGLSDSGGTKAGFWVKFNEVASGETVSVRLRLARQDQLGQNDTSPFAAAEHVIASRKHEADEFYDAVIPDTTSDEDRHIARRAFAGLNWCKQVYRYDINRWLDGDKGAPKPPDERLASQPDGRNTEWGHLSLADVISMPDEWEYPWFATWDLAFHCVALAHIDPAFAKEQLLLMCREWVMHPNGQMAAYEWNFSDVNPPVHAWAAWAVYQLDGGTDRQFLIRVFTKLLLNFGWWVNRKDVDGSNLFEGGFLGMDNIGPFDRSEPLPKGQRLEQSDATSWMAFFCLNLLRTAWELAREDSAWDEVATKFMEHFLTISRAMEHFGSSDLSLWDDDDGFFYDAVVDNGGRTQPVKIRSMVGLLPLIAVACEPDWVPDELRDFDRRLSWLLERRPDLTGAVVHTNFGGDVDTTFSLVSPDRLYRILERMLDPAEFLSPYGVRSLSAAYREGTHVVVDGQSLPIAYTPAESDNGMFGGNSNWRGPVWFPVNVLLIDALRTYATDMERTKAVEFPTASGQYMPLSNVADALEQRLIDLFRVARDGSGRRPSDPIHHPSGPLWGEAHPTFSEYFHGDTGRGLGASHQTGWTAMVAHLICAAGDNVHDGTDR